MLRRMDNIEIVAQPQKSLPVTLLGVDYTVRAPKKVGALALMMRLKNAGINPELMSDTINSLVKKMFGAEVAPAVMARLEDEEDDLDIDHLMMLMNALIERVSGDPIM